MASLISRKTPKPATAPVETRKREVKRIESAREEWEKRQKRRTDETAVAAALAAPSAGKKSRGRRRRKVWQTIASGRVGDGNGQGDVIDLRSPSSSPSIECVTPQANIRRNFTLTPDTTVASTSRNTTPIEGISDIAISSLHHLAASLASGSKRTEHQSPTSISSQTLDFAAEQASEEAIVAHHHSASTYPTPHASRKTSEEAVVAHHHPVSMSPILQIARGVSEEAVILYHHTSPTRQATRGISEEAVIVHHHNSPSPQRTRHPSEAAVTAYHHMSVSMSPIPPVSREMSEEAVIAHHHSSPPPARSQIVPNTPDASPISDRAVTEYHHHASTSASPLSLTSKPNNTQCIPAELTSPGEPSKIGPDKGKSFKSDLSIIKERNSLLRPFAYPVSTPLPSPPLTPIVKRSLIGDPFIERPTAGEEDVFMDADVENKAGFPSSDKELILSTPPRNASAKVQALHEPITPSRLGPSWKTETAPQSVIDAEEEFDELESESGDDTDEHETPRLSQLRLDPPLLFRPALFQGQVATDQDHDVDMGNPYSNAWALEYGIDPRQWDDTLIKASTQITHDEMDMDDHPESDAGNDNAGGGFSGEEDSDDDTEEEDDEDIVEGECGYRVFAGWADLTATGLAQGDNRHQIVSSPGSSIKSFRALTPRRPTALEATTGSRYRRHCSDNPRYSASPRSSSVRVSAELNSPITPPSQAGGGSVTAGLSPSYLFDSRFHYENINASTPDTQRESAAGRNMPKRDQVILALLQAGHTSLAEDVLRGYTADTHRVRNREMENAIW